MASYVTTAPWGAGLNGLFLANPVRGAQSATRAVYTNTDGSVVTVDGTGFTYDPGGVPTGGVVSTIEVVDGDGTTVRGRVVDAKALLANLDKGWMTPSFGTPAFSVATVLTIAQAYAGPWDSRSVLAGWDGNDRFTVSTYLPLVLEPGGGDDMIDATAAPSPRWGDTTGEAGPWGGLPVEISYAGHDGPGGAQFNYAGRLIVDPSGGIDSVLANVGGARMTRNADIFRGSDRPEFVAGLAGADVIDGGGAYDTVRYDLDEGAGGSGGVFVDLAQGGARDAFGDEDTLAGIEHAIGTNLPGDDIADASDILLGSDVFNIFAGLGGADYIDGRGWYDMADYSRDAAAGGGAAVYVNLAHTFGRDGWGNYDALLNIEHVRGTAGDDVLVGAAGHNMLQGLAGVDLLDGGEGDDDTVSYLADAGYGGMSGVIVDLATGAAIDGFGDGDMLLGIENVIGTERDREGSPGVGDILLGDGRATGLEGLAGNDRLDGRGGDDVLDSGAGWDVMTGGEGADLFHFDVSLEGIDIITDFVPGVDRIAIAAPWEGAGLSFEVADGAVAVWWGGGERGLVVMGAGSVAEVQAAFTVLPPS
jgi:Ca2+-binding RTX toxin-like protein